MHATVWVTDKQWATWYPQIPESKISLADN